MNDTETTSREPICRFRGVGKSYDTKKGKRVILRAADFEIPYLANVALLGPNGVGKSTFLKLIAGTEKPNSGKIDRFGRISWPLGFAGGYEKQMTGRQNVAFISRVYGIDPREAGEFVEDFADLGSYFDMPVQSYSQGMRQKLAFGLCMALDFDCYLIDEVTAVGDERFREKCQREFVARRDRAGVVMVSHSVATIRAYCDCAAVLIDGEVFFFEDLEEGITEFKLALKSLESA